MSAAPASIPSPSTGTLEIGPLSLNIYGLMIALGVIAGVWLFGRRLEEKGIGTREDANAIALWGVIAGVIGARLYHVITDWERYQDNLGDIVKVWEGGLGIPGGCSPASSSAPTSPTSGASRSARGSTPWLRRCRWPRRSGAGATTSTRSCTAGRPTCRGRWRSTTSTCRHGLPARDDVPPDVPLRVAVELRPVRPVAVDRQALPAGRRSSAGDVRARLRRRPVLDRGLAHRRRRRARPAVEPVGLLA